MTRFQKHQRERLRIHAKHLIQNLRHDTPLEIIAQNVTCLFLTALGVCGPLLADELFSWMLAHWRAENGHCAYESCDNKVNASQGSPSICETCELRDEQMAEEEMEDEQD